jgi:hypothetical protein
MYPFSGEKTGIMERNGETYYSEKYQCFVTHAISLKAGYSPENIALLDTSIKIFADLIKNFS